MIEVEATTAILLYLALFLFLCLGAWLFTHFRNGAKQAPPPLFRFSVCEFCHHNYLGKTGEKITKCPKCGSFNKSDFS